MVVDIVSSVASTCSVQIMGSMNWNRTGTVSTSDAEVVITPYGFDSVVARVLVDEGSVTAISGGIKVSFTPNTKQIVITTSASKTFSDVVALVSAMGDANAAHNQQVYGSLAPVKEAIQAGLAWNLIYVPSEAGPILPVSRTWAFAKSVPQWNYVLFDWDNYFASLMASMDSKEVAYSNIIQITRAATASGFVPNYSAGGIKSIDRTEPTVGAHILLKLYEKFKDQWIVELLFDNLLKWQNFMWDKRRANETLGLISLGALNFPAVGKSGCSDSGSAMQCARYERLVVFVRLFVFFVVCFYVHVCVCSFVVCVRDTKGGVC